MIQRIHEIKTGTKLIGIHGKAGSGKDTICAYLAENYQNVYREAFADSLKATCAAAFGVPLSYFYDLDMKEIINPYWGVSYRKMAQYLGTELFRNNIDSLIPEGRSDFWIRRLTGLINGDLIGSSENQNGAFVSYNEDDIIVVPDVRFGNETDWIQANSGIVIWVQRPDSLQVGINGHISEADIDTNGMYKISNFDTLRSLYDQVDFFAQSEGLKPIETNEIDLSKI